MEKPIIAIDFDSTLADTMIPFVKYVNKIYNKNFSKDQIAEWGFFQKELGWSVEDEYHIFHKVWRQDDYILPPTEPHLGKIVKAIKDKGYRITIVTKRGNAESVRTTAKWIEDHGIEYDDYICVMDSRPKTDFPWDILVDDAWHYIKDIPSDRTGLLYTQPWNIAFQYKYRINKLSDIVEKNIL